MYKRIFDIDPWKIATHTLDKENKRLMESITSIGNGYMGMRGNFEESYSGDSHRGTYLAGVWYPDKTKVGWWKNGYPHYFGKVINATNFIGINIRVNGVEIDLGALEVNNFYYELDMKNGLLTRSFTYQDNDSEINFKFQRFLSIETKELCFIKVTLEVVKGNPRISIDSFLDGNVKNEDSNYEERFWNERNSGNNGEVSYLTTQTIPNPFEIPQFTITCSMKNKINTNKKLTRDTAIMKVIESYEGVVSTGEQLVLEKTVAIVTSRDIPEEKQIEKSVELLEEADKKSFLEHLNEQNIAWKSRWEKSDIIIKGDDEAQQGIRFNLFQLFSTYYGEDERLNIGPKGFTGEKYGGATYWDTEAYAVPFYLALADPKVTRNLLLYRYNQSEGAHINAQRQGLKGALYPMVTFTGVECHNEWEITFEEIHRNGAMVYAVYNYTTYTGDEEYLKNEGLEVVVEIARFWADRVHYSKRKDKYMIHGVTGPNEYENNINNNWYTNKLASWVLQYAMESLEKFPERKSDLKVTKDELDKWKDIVDKMYLPYDEDLGVFVQHDTFLDKDLMPVSALDEKNLPLNQNWSWDKILRSCFIKQADVLQGIYFFGDEFKREEKERNFDFYEPMTVHESSLSPSIHAVLAAELGKEEKALEMYRRTARLDLDNYNNDTQDGLHITSMTGSWLAIVQGFAGMKTHSGLSFNPFLPNGWDNYEFHINYRGRLMRINVDKDGTVITLLEGEPIEVAIYERKHLLSKENEINTNKQEIEN